LPVFCESKSLLIKIVFFFLCKFSDFVKTLLTKAYLTHKKKKPENLMRIYGVS
jgi:hypothetical protein